MTQLAAPNLRLAGHDILLWAGGGQHGPEIPRSWLLRPSGTGHRMLLIDIKDYFARKLAMWSDRRHEEYCGRDWFDVGVTAEFGRVVQFLSRPPRRDQVFGRGVDGDER